VSLKNLFLCHYYCSFGGNIVKKGNVSQVPIIDKQKLNLEQKLFLWKNVFNKNVLQSSLK